MTPSMITIETENCNYISQDFYNNTINSINLNQISCTCGDTHALLLSSMVPYSQIPTAVQIDTIAALEEGIPLDSVLSGQCCVDESNLRHIIRSYRLHWKERLLSERINLSPFSYLIRKCFSCFSRSFMQIKNTRNKLFSAPT